MDLSQLDEALLPYEEELRSQERLRKLLGVKEVDRPTYEKDIIGPIERFDRSRNAFATLMPDNPYGAEFRQRFKARTGFADRTSLPYSELEPADRIGQSLSKATMRLCREYHPQPLPVTPSDGRVEFDDKAQLARLIKKVALFLGADMVRITRVDQRWVYQDIDITHKYVILLVVAHERRFLATAPSHLSTTSTADSYSRLKFIATQLTDFICGLGYDTAYRETAGANPDMLVVPMAIDAGIGELGRTSRVLSPEFGLNMRIKPVTTDLPLEVDKPISFKVKDFCLVCENCATYCPANAVPFGPPTEQPIDIHNNPGVRKWYVDAERCLTFFAMNKKKWNSCGGRCIAVCPWNKPLAPSHNVVRWLAIHSPDFIRRLLIRGDRLIYHRTTKIKHGRLKK